MAKQMAKPIDDITNAELVSFPVWEFATDQEDMVDETALRPVLKLPVTSGRGILFCAQIRLHCGETFWALLGGIDPQDAEWTAQCVTVSILRGESRFHLARPIDFFYETHGPRALCDFLELKLEDVFPIHYDVSALCYGEPAAVAGEIEF